METFILDTARIRDLTPLALDGNGRMRVLPAAFWAGTTRAERALFGHTHGIYSFPTIELVEHLREQIAGRAAIEIGAGHGVLAEALGIPATDNFMQVREPYRTTYDKLGIPPVRYGPNVINCHAYRAVRDFRPEVVIACWVTHKLDPARPEAEGNPIGLDEHDILAMCAEYIFVGHRKVHENKAIWELPHHIAYPDFMYSRAGNTSPDFIATWRRAHAVQG